MVSFRTVRSYPLLLLSTLPVSVLGGDILSTNGFSSCVDNPDIQVKAMNIQYDRNTRVINFDVAGSSNKAQKVEATLVVSAYGQQVYTKSFNPCDTGMAEMCPLPAGEFASKGQQTIPEEYASKIPSIAFSVPDLDGQAKLELKNVDTGEDVACLTSHVGNGRTFKSSTISWIAGGIVAAAFALSALTALAAGGAPGAAAPSPTFSETFGWFQGMAMNGMLSVPYPVVYQSFTSNFGFSTGLIPWGQMQMTIDNFRKATGGNLTEDSYTYLRNVTIVYPDGTKAGSGSELSLTRRALDSVILYARDGTEVSVNGTSSSFGDAGGSNNSTSGAESKEQHLVKNLQAYVEQLTIPQANTFMTLLLVFAIVIAAIVVLILLGKVLLEFWGLFGKLPKSMESWRKRYWWRLAKAVTNLILLLYGVWTLYCIYQFTNGDSWAAKALAGVTLGLFTAVLGFFTWKIWYKARQSKKLEGDATKLYEDKETWIKYSLFYDSYKKGYWWVFVPAIIYMFAKGVVIAGANGHGLTQTAGQLIIESIMLVFLLWFRPYTLKSGNWINLTIHVVRVISVICVLVFVEELGLSQTTKTITGLVLIVVQCVLTGVLAILIAVNAIITCIRENPHRKRRKDAEKLNRDLDNLTPLDARNSLLMESMVQTGYKAPMVTSEPYSDRHDRFYESVPLRPHSPAVGSDIPLDDRPSRFERDASNQRLISSAASMGYRDESTSRSHRYRDKSVSRSPSVSRQPRLPDVDLGHDFGRAA
ncbi:TRP-domain-containing protein [Polychaeton citri CBS 116435]|uniref:TRP-domain-containing protein n=1 Tax=Polychaeton citri CBS 116435 TaxID=1314669 RepID=A0A9P4UT18_9PEZI|nr:TRP-domain-containing protein [Polychaeton citri CBS 116435]